MKFTPQQLLTLKNANVISQDEYNKRINELNPQQQLSSDVNTRIAELEDSLKTDSVTGVLSNKLSTAFGDELPTGLLTAGKALGLGSQDWYNQQIAQQQAEAEQSRQELSKAAQESTTAKVGDILGGAVSTIVPSALAGLGAGIVSGGNPLAIGGAAGTVATAIGAGQDTAEFETRRKAELQNKGLTPQQIQQQVDNELTGQFVKSAALEGASNLASLGIAGKIGKETLKYLPSVGKAVAVDAPIGAVTGALSEQVIGSGLEGGADTNLIAEKALMGGIAGGALSGGFAAIGTRGSRKEALTEAQQGREGTQNQEFRASLPLLEKSAQERLDFLQSKETGNVQYELRDALNANGEIIPNRKQVFGIIKEQPKVEETTTTLDQANIETQKPLTQEEQLVQDGLFTETQPTTEGITQVVEQPQNIKDKTISVLNEIDQIIKDDTLDNNQKKTLVEESLINNTVKTDDILGQQFNDNELLSYKDSIKFLNENTTKEKGGIDQESIDTQLGYRDTILKSSNDLNKLDNDQVLVNTEKLNKDNISIVNEDFDTTKDRNLVLDTLKDDTLKVGQSPSGLSIVDPIAFPSGKYKIGDGRIDEIKTKSGKNTVSLIATLKSIKDQSVRSMENAWNNINPNDDYKIVINNKPSFKKQDGSIQQGAIEIFNTRTGEKEGYVLNSDINQFIQNAVKSGYADNIKVNFVWERVPYRKGSSETGQFHKSGDYKHRLKTVVQIDLPKGKSFDDATYKALKENKLTEEMLKAPTKEQEVQAKTVEKLSAQEKKAADLTNLENFAKKTIDDVRNNQDFDNLIKEYGTPTLLNKTFKQSSLDQKILKDYAFDRLSVLNKDLYNPLVKKEHDNLKQSIETIKQKNAQKEADIVANQKAKEDKISAKKARDEEIAKVNAEKERIKQEKIAERKAKQEELAKIKAEKEAKKNQPKVETKVEEKPVVKTEVKKEKPVKVEQPKVEKKTVVKTEEKTVETKVKQEPTKVETKIEQPTTKVEEEFIPKDNKGRDITNLYNTRELPVSVAKEALENIIDDAVEKTTGKEWFKKLFKQVYANNTKYLDELKDNYGDDIFNYAKQVIKEIDKEMNISANKAKPRSETKAKSNPINVQKANKDDLSVSSKKQLKEENEVLSTIKDEEVKNEYKQITQELDAEEKKIRAKRNSENKKVKQVDSSNVNESTVAQLKKDAENEEIINSIRARLELMQKGKQIVPNMNVIFDYKSKKHTEENSKVIDLIKKQKEKNVAGALVVDENQKQHIYLNIENIKKTIDNEPAFKGMSINDYAEYVYSHETGHINLDSLFDNNKSLKEFIEKNAKGKILKGLYEVKKNTYPGKSELVLWKEVFSDMLGGRMISLDKDGKVKVQTIAEFTETFKNYNTTDAKSLLNKFKSVVNDLTGKKIFKEKTEGATFKDVMDEFQRISESKSDYVNSKRNVEIGKQLNREATVEFNLIPTSFISAGYKEGMKAKAGALGDYFDFGKQSLGGFARMLKQTDIRAASDKFFGDGYKIVSDMESMLESIVKLLDRDTKKFKDLIIKSDKDKISADQLTNINKAIAKIVRDININKDIPSLKELVDDYKLTNFEADFVDTWMNKQVNGQKYKSKSEILNALNEYKLITEDEFNNKFRNIDEYDIDDLKNDADLKIVKLVNDYFKYKNLLVNKNRTQAQEKQFQSLKEFFKNNQLDDRKLNGLSARIQNTYEKSKEFEVLRVPHGKYYISIRNKEGDLVFFDQYSNNFKKNTELKRLQRDPKYKGLIIEQDKIDRSNEKMNDPEYKVNKYIKEWSEQDDANFDYVRNLFNSIDELSRVTAFNMYNKRIDNYADELIGMNKTDVAEEIKKLKGTVLSVENGVLSKLRGVTSIFTLALNMSSAVMNLSGLGMVLPAVANRYNAFDSYTKAIGTITDKKLLNLLLKSDDETALKYLKEKLVPNDLEAQKIIDDLYFSGILLGTGNYDVKAARSAIESTRLTRGWEKIQDYGMRPFSVTEKMNRIATAAMFLDIAKKQDIKNRFEAFDFIRTNIYKTQGNYNKSGRPAFLSGEIGALVWQFKQYPQAIIGKFLSTAIGSFKGNKEDMREFGFLLTSFILLGGLKGLPGIDDLNELYNGIGKAAGNYDADMKKSIKDSLSDNALTRLVYSGIFSPDTGLGMIDLSDKLSLGKFVPGLKVFDPTRNTQDRTLSLFEILGPAGQKYPKAAIDLYDSIGEQNMYKAIKALPLNAVSNATQGTAALLTGNYLTKEGKASISTGEGFVEEFASPMLKILGFNPSRLNKINEIITDSYTLSGNQKYARQTANRFAAEGDMEKAMEVVRQWNEEYPNAKIKLDRDSINKVKKNIELETNALDRISNSLNKDISRIALEEAEEEGLED